MLSNFRAATCGRTFGRASLYFTLFRFLDRIFFFRKFFTFKNASSKFHQTFRLYRTDIHKNMSAERKKMLLRAHGWGRIEGYHRGVKWMGCVRLSVGDTDSIL